MTFAPGYAFKRRGFNNLYVVLNIGIDYFSCLEMIQVEDQIKMSKITDLTLQSILDSTFVGYMDIQSTLHKVDGPSQHKLL